MQLKGIEDLQASIYLYPVALNRGDLLLSVYMSFAAANPYRDSSHFGSISLLLKKIDRQNVLTALKRIVPEDQHISRIIRQQQIDIARISVMEWRWESPKFAAILKHGNVRLKLQCTTLLLGSS